MKQKYLILLLVVWISACFYLFHIIYAGVKETAISELNSRQMILAQQAQRGIEGFFDNTIILLTKISESAHVITLDKRGRREMDFALQINPGFITAITRVDTAGQIVYSTPYVKGVIGRDISSQPHVREILKNHKPIVSDVFTAVQGYRAIALHVPVFEENRFRGTIGALINFQKISKRYLEDIRLGETGYAWMTSRDGIELYCPVPGHIGNSVFDNCKNFPAIIAMANEMIRGRQGVTSYTFDMIRDRQQKTVKKHAVYLPIKMADTFWSIAVSSIEDEVLATLVAFKNKLILVLALLLFGSFIFAYYGMKAWGIVKEEGEKRKVEEALRESEKRFRELAELLPEAIYETDLNGNITYANRQAFDQFGYTQHDFDRGLNNLQMLAAADHGRAMKNIQRVLKGEATGISEYPALRKDGSTFPALVRSTAVIRGGKVAGLRGLIIDITEIKRLEAKLAQAQKMDSIGNLAGGIAHDFNNILSSIIGYTELSLDDVAKGSLLEDNLKEVYTAARRARDLVKQILAFAQQTTEEVKPIQVDIIVKEVLKLIRSTIPADIEIRPKIESNSLILGNPAQVQQIFLNLCTNAAQAMEAAGGILEVALQDVTLDDRSELKPGNYLKATVSDTGPGIAPDVIDFIFEPYYTTKDSGKGTGMGLALVHGFVESYGGKISVESETGRGATFIVYLPTTRKRETDRPYEAEALPSGDEKIMLVDDELPIAKMVAQVLERLGYTVTTRTSSVEALELFRAKPGEFDLVVTDMTMPNMTGDRLAIELMKLRPDIPVIMCTGYSKKISDESALKIGLKAFLYKPLVKADLARTVRKVLDEQKGPIRP